jgi:hypothetical protein
MARIRAFLQLLCMLSLLTTSGAALAANPTLTSLDNGVYVSTASESGNKVRLAAIGMELKIHGRMADTVMEITLANDSDDEVEGHFALEMPADAVVTGYALDVKGVMIDGILLDQPTAKAVYEDEIRQGIDPGLAEVAAGNIFKTRVYPIAAGSVRKIRIQFMAPVDLANGYVLPLQTDGAVGAFSLSVDISGFKNAPQIALPFAGKMALTKKGNRWIGTAGAATNSKLTDALKINGGAVDGEMLVSNHSNGRSFFQIADFDAKRRAKPQPVKRMRVYWDSSLSRRDDLIEEEAALVSDLVTKTGAATVDVVRFNTAEPEVATIATGEQAATLLKSTVYRGGTSFKGLDDVKLADAELCLLFSDGMPTIETDARFKPDCRLMIVTSAPDANMLRLGLIARGARGQLLRLDKTNRTALAERIVKPAIAVVAAKGSDRRKLPFRSLTAPDGSWFAIGRAPDNGEVQMSITGLGNGVSQRFYSVSENGIGSSDAAGALWAAEELEHLADNPMKRDDMHDIAKSFNVASPTMALLVLEQPDQYLRNNIKPPKGFDEEWMEEYRDGKSERDEEEAEAKAERLETVRERWAERKTWWNTKFDPPKRVTRKKRESGANSALEGADAAAERAPAPPPAAVAPAPNGSAAPSDAEEDYDLGNIIVTASRMADGSQYSVALAVTTFEGLDEDGEPIKMEIADVLSDQPYLQALDKAVVDRRLAVLAEQEKTFGSLPAFYLDVAEWFRLKGDAKLSEALMLSALELPVADDETRLIVAFRLQRMGRLDEAIRVLELLEIRTPNRPQPKRSLALALIERGKKKGTSGATDLERAFKYLVDVALTPNQSDFDGIEVVALMEANAIIPMIEEAGGKWELDGKLLGSFDTDIRIVIEWTNDDADIDLWVFEPTGEKTYFGNQQSQAGGTITNDMTDGYGPEEYVLKRAIAGDYKVRIDGYSPDRLNPNGKGRVMVRLIRDFARMNQKEELVDAELSFERGDNVDDEGSRLVATMKVGEKGR